MRRVLLCTMYSNNKKCGNKYKRACSLFENTDLPNSVQALR